MTVTEEDFQKRQSDLADLRSRVEVARAKKDNAERTVAREIDSAGLEAERIRLEAELAELKNEGTLTSVREENSGLIADVKDEKKAAAAAAKEGE